MAALTEKIGVGLSNPMIRKMHKKVHGVQHTDSKDSTLAGIGGKVAYFIILVAIGTIAYFVLHPTFIAQAGKEGVVHFLHDNKFFNFNFTLMEGLAFLITTFVSLVLPLLAFLIRPLIPVVGSLYCLCQGYMIGFITGNLASDYQWIGICAFFITMILVGIMMILYTMGIAKPNKKIRSILSIFFFTSLITGLVGFVLYLIPWTRPYMGMVQYYLTSPAISIGISALYILIATLFLLVDFDTIERCIEDHMPKKYEWMAAWGLAYTIVYLYLKILNLIIKIVSYSSDSK